MAGKRIGDHQVGIYKKLRTKLGQEVAAAKTGISVRSARRIDASDALPSQREARSWRTRTDPFESVWESELVPMLAAAPALTATTLLEEIQRRYPGQYEDGLLRTLQRRVRTWSASYGKEREVFFAQAHPPGRLGLSDFTHAAVLQVTIAGATLLHLLYQFALAYSGWRYVEVVLGGESFMALSSGHENGSIESRQGTLKRTMEQALLLRGHRDFADLDAYRLFVAEVFGRLNGRVSRKFNEERAMLLALPARRSSDYEEVDARVTKYCTMTVKKVLYTAPSRLVGHRLKVRVFAERLECWLGNVCVLELRRGQPDPVSGRGKVVDYRHLLPALKRKPGALARSVLRDALFPRTEYRQMWVQLKDCLPEAQACRLMVGLLDLAGNGGCEAALAQRLAVLLAAGEMPDLEELQQEMAPRPAQCPIVTVVLPTLASYDCLLEAA